MGEHAQAAVQRAAAGALVMAALTIVLLLAVELINVTAAQPDAPLAARLALSLARLDLSILPPMVAFGAAGGLAAWATTAR
jgi:hypothetical protein